MKKMKKIFAVLLTLAMVLGMGMTSFAANSIEIPVTNAEGATFQWLQLIKTAPSQPTGWEFTSATIANDYKTALGAPDDQTAIWMLIKYKNPTATNIPSNITIDSETMESKITNAIKNVANESNLSLSPQTPANKVQVDAAGVYYIRANEQGYAYNPMAAYVSFGNLEDGSVDVNNLSTEGIEAKKEDISVGKTSNDTNKVTEIGRIETYYVSSIVPFVPLGDSDRSYDVKDTIIGAKYVESATDTVTLNIYFGKSVEEVKAGGVTKDDSVPATIVDTTVDSKEAQTFLANLDKVLTNNDHAGQSIVITYNAKVTDVTVGNDVTIGTADNNGNFNSGSNSAHEDLYTAKITINKVDEKNESIKLAGAGFIIGKSDTEYAKFDSNNKFVEWVAESQATEVKTDTDGTLTVSGLDEGTYHIIEKTAPTGYSINANIPDVTIKTTEKVTADTVEKVLSATSIVKDTTLASLPGTGGIGTTIFTIGGCAIMIIAAALFFASRRKAAK